MLLLAANIDQLAAFDLVGHGASIRAVMGARPMEMLRLELFVHVLPPGESYGRVVIFVRVTK
jgi:hypothetical protein